MLRFVEILMLELTFPGCDLALFEPREAEVESWVGMRAEWKPFVPRPASLPVNLLPRGMKRN